MKVFFFCRGRFSVVVKGVEKTNDHIVAGKLLELRPEREVAVNREFEALRRLRHERIAQLLEAYRAPGSEVAVLIMEKLQGADILTYFSSRHEYNEQMVCNAVTQVSSFFLLNLYLYHKCTCTWCFKSVTSLFRFLMVFNIYTGEDCAIWTCSLIT